MQNTKNIKSVIIIDPVSSGFWLKRSAVDAGFQVIAVFTMTPEELHASGKAMPKAEKYRDCAQVIYAKTVDAVLQEVSANFSVQGVIAGSEPAVELADSLAHTLGLPGNAIASSSARRNKIDMRRRVRGAGLSSVDFAECHDTEDAVRFHLKHNAPIVIKTPRGAGAQHVYVCSTAHEVRVAHQKIVKIPNVFGEIATTSLVEELIDGPQYAVDTFGDGERVIVTSIWAQTLESSSADGNIFSGARLVTGDEELAALADVIEYSISVAHALGIKRGPGLVEVRKSSTRGPTLIEAASRLTGLDLPRLVEQCGDFSPLAATIQAFTSSTFVVAERVKFRRDAMLHFQSVDKTGIVASVMGLDEIRALPSYFSHKLFINADSPVVASRDLATIPLYVYLVHDKSAQIAEDIAEIQNYFGVELKKERRAANRGPSGRRTDGENRVRMSDVIADASRQDAV